MFQELILTQRTAYTSADNGFDLPVFDLIFSRDYEMTMRKEWSNDAEWMEEFKSWIQHPSENTNHLVQVLKVYVMKNGRTDQSVSDDQTIFSKAITLIDIGFESLEVRLTKEKIADTYTSSSYTVRSVPKPLKNSESPLSQSSSSTTSEKVIRGGRAPRIQLATNPKEFIKLRASCKHTKKKPLINQ